MSSDILHLMRRIATALTRSGRTPTHFARIVPLLAAALLMASHPAYSQANNANHSVDPGFLVLAPDRGFQGNEETRDAFEIFSVGRNAVLVYVTDERARQALRDGLQSLKQNGARRIIALPLFVSQASARFELARRMLDEIAHAVGAANEIDSEISYARLFGESYLAVEALADRFRAVHDRAGRRLVIIGYGTDDEGSVRAQADWQRIAQKAAQGFGFASVKAVVWHDRSVPKHEEQWKATERILAQATGEGAVIVPFHFGQKLDGMMSFNAYLRRILPPGSVLVDEEASTPSVMAMWMAREANRHTLPKPEEIGVVVLAHGSDYHWNETMREAARPLEARYKIEYCFTMADPPLVERAVRRLERRGVKAIVIVRVFGLEASFRSDVERMIGLDVEQESPAVAGVPLPHKHETATGHDHGATHAHPSGNAGAPAARIRSAVPIGTVGGLEAHPLFAAALLDRVQNLSRDSGRETVILVAHGSRSDAENERWLALLDELAAQMRANGGGEFRAIRYATWREDWPDKRVSRIAQVRAMVEEASRDGGRAIVVPARTNAQGQEKQFLSGLSFELGSGFAPHPLFARWLEEKINTGAAALGFSAAQAHAHGHH